MSVPITINLEDDNLAYAAHLLQSGQFAAPEDILLAAISQMRETDTAYVQNKSENEDSNINYDDYDENNATFEMNEDDMHETSEYDEEEEGEAEVTIEDVFKEARSKGYI